MKNIFSMDDPDYHKHKLFDPIVSLKTYLNIIYSIVQSPLYLVLSIPLYFFLVPGLLFLPIYIGTPLMNLAFLYARNLVPINNIVFRNILRYEVPKIESPLPPADSTRLQAFKYFSSQRRYWLRMVYFLLQPFLGIISVVILGLVGLLAYLMIYVPFNAIFGHIKVFNFYEGDMFIIAVFAFFMGFILWAAMLHLINIWMDIIKKFTIYCTGR